MINGSAAREAAPDEEGPAGDGERLPETSHAVDVMFFMLGLNDEAGGEEEQGLEEGVGQEMEEAGGERAETEGEEHVAHLTHGGVREARASKSRCPSAQTAP